MVSVVTLNVEADGGVPPPAHRARILYRHARLEWTASESCELDSLDVVQGASRHHLIREFPISSFLAERICLESPGRAFIAEKYCQTTVCRRGPSFARRGRGGRWDHRAMSSWPGLLSPSRPVRSQSEMRCNHRRHNTSCEPTASEAGQDSPSKAVSREGVTPSPAPRASLRLVLAPDACRWALVFAGR